MRQMSDNAHLSDMPEPPRRPSAAISCPAGSNSYRGIRPMTKMREIPLDSARRAAAVPDERGAVHFLRVKRGIRMRNGTRR